MKMYKTRTEKRTQEKESLKKNVKRKGLATLNVVLWWERLKTLFLYLAEQLPWV